MRLLSLLALIVVVSFGASAQEEIHINSASAFVEAIGSNRVIVVASGNYTLTEAMQYENANATWRDEFDGPELVIRNVSDLTIRADGPAQLLASPRYVFTLRFENCENLRFENLTMGHTDAGYCIGGVVGLEACRNVEFENCLLFGCGTIGVAMYDVENFSFVNSTITECTYGLLGIENSRNVEFVESRFTRTGEFDLISIRGGSKNVRFEECEFSDNWCGDFMPHLFSVEEDCQTVALTDCLFRDNGCPSFAANPAMLAIEGTTFEDNTFAPADGRRRP